MPDPTAERLLAAIADALPRLRALPDAESARPLAPGHWSPREVIGHLVDSAIVNQERFLRGAAQDDLVFPGYPQDAWVTRQQYVTVPWGELLDLWAALNRHVARTIAAIPAAERAREHSRHTLDRIAWRTVASSAPATLDYLMADYVGHLEHHLRQVLGPGAHR